MSKSGSSLRALVLTPDRIPSFLIPSPRLHWGSSDRTRLLSDPDDDEAPPSPRGSLLRVPSPRPQDEDADTDLTTRAAMSLPHVGRVTTPYGFRAVLAASPCTRRRESLFHRRRAAPPAPADGPPGPGARSSPPRPRSPRLQPVKALGLQVMEELRKPAAALRALSPARRRTRPR